MPKGNRPDYKVVVGRDTERNGEPATVWTQIGAGWSIKEGGISITLDAVPMNGRLILFQNKDE